MLLCLLKSTGTPCCQTLQCLKPSVIFSSLVGTSNLRGPLLHLFTNISIIYF
ncbi:hypothetical protein CFP56_036404 [Quercus suber]|uniref:Uncharacterized protein n=1 Tax=Quercus suber TaxID=58331 RepID=A0AAW0LS67_QUESU